MSADLSVKQTAFFQRIKQALPFLSKEIAESMAEPATPVYDQPSVPFTGGVWVSDPETPAVWELYFRNGILVQKREV